MKKIIFLALIVVGLFAFTNSALAEIKPLSEQIYLEYEGEELLYEDFFTNENITEEERIHFLKEYLEILINKITKLSDSSEPEDILEKYGFQLELTFVVGYLGSRDEFSILEKNLKVLQAIGFHIRPSDFRVTESFHANLYRSPDTDILIDIVNSYPDTDYEKEALYELARLIIHSNINRGNTNVRLKLLMRQLQGGYLFLQKYPNDSRAEDIKEIYNFIKEGYITGSDKSLPEPEGVGFRQFNDDYYEKYLFSLFIQKRGDYPNFSFNINKKPLEELLEDPLGYVEIITDEGEIMESNAYLELQKQKYYEKISDFIDVSEFDEEGNRNKNYIDIKRAQIDMWIGGYEEDHSFRPENEVIRQDFAKMLMKGFRKGNLYRDPETGRYLDAGEFLDKNFPDAPDTPEQQGYLAKAIELGTMKGYPDGTLQPERDISVGEALKMTLEMLGSHDEEKEYDFGDPDDFSPYVVYIEKNDIDLDFVDSGLLDELITRGQCVELISRILEIEGVYTKTKIEKEADTDKNENKNKNESNTQDESDDTSKDKTETGQKDSEKDMTDKDYKDAINTYRKIVVNIWNEIRK